MTMTELKTNKEYEWFLKEMEVKHTSQKLKLVWGCVDADYEIVEMTALMEKGEAGPRLKDLMQKLNGIVPGGSVPKPTDFFKRGMHLFSKVQMHWPESRTEIPLYEFIYETIKPERTKKQAASESDIKKVMFRVGQAKTYIEARSKVEAYDPSLVPVLDELVTLGKVVLT
jgi:hypothetical protein